MKADLCLKNATIVTESNVFHGSLATRDGRILMLLKGPESIPAIETIDLHGKLLMPGLIDAHVHMHDPAREAWEGYFAGSCAAAAGGVTTILDMPFAPRVTDSQILQTKQQAARAKSLVDVGHWGLLERGNAASLREMHDAGAVAFKAFMCGESPPGYVDAFGLYQGMEEIARWGGLLGVHAENDSLVKGLAERLRAAGRRDARAWAESRPPVVEREAVQQALLMASETGARLHFCHMSTAEGIHAIQRARRKGLTVTSETCPQYLALDEEDLVKLGPLAKCTPAIRKRELVEQLWVAVLGGQVDLIVSDHCPCPRELKDISRDGIWQAWEGLPGVQTMLPILLTEGVHRRGLPLQSLVRMTSANAARLYGLYPEKGHLQPGADADLVVVDPEREWTLEAEMLFSRHKFSPFEGRTFRGAVVQTIVRGRTVFLDGHIVAEPGYGKVIIPTRADQAMSQRA